MSWENVKLADVEYHERPKELPAGRYKFQLMPGAVYRVNPFNGQNELNVRFTVTDHPSLNGMSIFQTYGDPEGINPKTGKPLAFIAQQLKKLEVVLGIDSYPGEDPAQYLNRAAQQNPVFLGTVVEEHFKRKDGSAGSKTKFSPFAIEPAA